MCASAGACIYCGWHQSIYVLLDVFLLIFVLVADMVEYGPVETTFEI
jgi:hypothetical protein